MNTLGEWNEYKENKKNQFNGGNNEKDNTLTINLLKWDIKYHWVYKEELKLLTRLQFKYLVAFRSGHCELNDRKNMDLIQNYV